MQCPLPGIPGTETYTPSASCLALVGALALPTTPEGAQAVDSAVKYACWALVRSRKLPLPCGMLAQLAAARHDAHATTYGFVLSAPVVGRIAQVRHRAGRHTQMSTRLPARKLGQDSSATRLAHG